MVLASRGRAQRGGGGDWGGYNTPAQAQIVTETQIQTRTMVSTAPTQAPTTVVQATTVIRVSTIQVPVQAEASTVTSVSAKVITSVVPAAAAAGGGSSNIPAGSQSSSLSHSQGQDSDNLTVDPFGSERVLSASATVSGSVSGSTNDTSASLALSANPGSQTGSTISGPSRSSGLSSTIKGELEVETTGIPDIRDASEGVVYGRVSQPSLLSILGEK